MTSAVAMKAEADAGAPNLLIVNQNTCHPEHSEGSCTTGKILRRELLRMTSKQNCKEEIERIEQERRKTC